MTNPEQQQITRAEMLGFDVPKPLWAKLADRIPVLPTVPGGVTTDAIEAAMEAAFEATQAADDVITEDDAYRALHSEPEELADAEYRKALASGDTKAKYDADRWRRVRLETEHRFNQAVSVARSKVAEAQRVIRAEAPNLIEGSNARLIAARREWEDTYAAMLAAKRAFAVAADQRADLLLATGEDKQNTATVNTASILRNTPVSQYVIGPVNAVPHEDGRAVIVRLYALGAEGLEDQL